MPRHHVVLAHDFSASPEEVFDFLSDHEQFGQLWPASIRRIRAGESEPNGIGSVREVRIGPLVIEETIVAFRRPELIEYEVTRGGPIKNHRGTLQISRTQDGSHLDYRIVFDARIPFTGGLISRTLERDFAGNIGGVAAQINAPAHDKGS